MSAENEKQDEQESQEEAEVVETQEQPEETTAEGKLKVFKDEHDPRKAIYEKSDSMRFPKPPEPEQEQIEPEETETEEVEEVKTGEEETKEEELTPREKRRLENLEAKEKRLTAWEKRLVEQFQAAGKPPEKKEVGDASQTPLRYLTDEQFDERYNELFADSPARARKFEKSVEQAKAEVARETEEQRVETAFRDFRDAYPDVTEEDWIHMNDPAFYSKYDDITRMMQRGELFATFVAARGRLVEERLAAEREEARGKEREKEDEVRKRNEKKKKGTVLRVQTRVTPTEKKEEGYQPESRSDYVKRKIHEARVRQGLEAPQQK